MFRAHRKPAKAALIENAPNGPFRDLDPEAACNDRLEIGAAPADHAVFHRVRRRLHDLLQLRQLVWLEKGLATGTRPVKQSARPFRIIAVNPIPERLPVHSGHLGRIAPARAVKDRSKRQKAPGLIAIARQARKLA